MFSYSRQLTLFNICNASDIKSQLDSAELKNKRLMEAFKKTSQQFREVSYQLLGYKIDLDTPCQNQYRLMNVYAESPNDYLIFQVRDRI